MTETPNPAMLKLAGAAIGGYVLGRFKKGRAAISFAMWMAGAKDPKAMLRDGLISAAQTPEAQQLLSQLRGPALEAGRKVASATFQNQLGALTAALEQRTKAIGSGDEETDPSPRKKRRKDGSRAEERPDDEELAPEQDEAADDTDEYDEELADDELEDTDEDTDDYEDEEDEPEDDAAEADTAEDEPGTAQAAEPVRERRPARKSARSSDADEPARKKARPAAKRSAQPATKAKATPPSDDEPPKKRTPARRNAPSGRAPRRNRTEGARS